MNESEQKEFSKLRSDNEVLREHLRTVNPEMSAYILKIQDLKDALESARAELDRADNFADKLVADAMAKGRTLAMEEAARLTYQALVDSAASPDVKGELQLMRLCALADSVSDSILALAPLPASLVAVPREAVLFLREALRKGRK